MFMNYIVHTDGGSRGNPGNAAIGIIIKNELGELIWEVGERIGITTNNVAEHSAVRRALQYFVESKLHPEKISFFLDSLLVVQQLSHNYKIKKKDLAEIATETWSLVAKLSCPVTFTHIYREKNAGADKLVNQALDLN